ncbi:MAG: hypothetical protein AAF826_04230 [Pseudomonadota bacterium]
MNIETWPVMRRAKVLERILTGLMIFIGIGATTLIGSLVFDVDGLTVFYTETLGYAGASLLEWQLISLTCVALVHLGILIAAAWHARNVFGFLARADLEQSARSSGKVATMLWAVLVYSIFAHTLGVLIVTWEFPEGQRALSLTLGSLHISALIAALIASLFAQALSLGAELWRDHNEVI